MWLNNRVSNNGSMRRTLFRMHWISTQQSSSIEYDQNFVKDVFSGFISLRLNIGLIMGHPLPLTVCDPNSTNYHFVT